MVIQNQRCSCSKQIETIYLVVITVVATVSVLMPVFMIMIEIFTRTDVVKYVFSLFA